FPRSSRSASHPHGEVLPQRVTFGVGLPHEDAAQIGMTAESDPEHVVRLPLQPVGAPPQRHDGVDGQVPARVEFDLDPQLGAAREGSQLVDQLERSLAVAVLDRRHIDQVIVALLRRFPQPGHRVEQTFARNVDDGVAARLEPAADRVAEGRAQGVDGGVHAERNWWTELPNGSEISSICSGGSRRPRSSSGCSSRRGTRSNSDSPLIFLCSRSTPYNSPSGRGGHPGTYTSTGTIVSTPCTIA